MNYFRQLYYDMRHQKVTTWVSVSGTALSIFLVLVFFMVQQVKIVGVAPETNRERILIGGSLDIHAFKDGREIWTQSGAMSYKIARQMYGNLDGIEMVAYTNAWTESYEVGESANNSTSLIGKITDAAFWNMYDFKFISGSPYNEASCESGDKKVVLSRTAARKMFKKEDVAGQSVYVNSVPYIVCGVVDDVSPLLKATYSDIYLPLGPEQREVNDYFGDIMVLLLMKPGVKEQDIKKQMEEMYVKFNSSLADQNLVAVNHEGPHNSEVFSNDMAFSNRTPDLSIAHRETYILYCLLLLLPAINLSSMMRGRLRSRVSEIGVRRAFGAKRSGIIMQILGENMVVSILGGIIGLVVSILFMLFLSSFFFSYGVESNSLEMNYYNPTFMMLFRWKNFVIALCACVVLNILSASVPAWIASRVEPALAISKSRA